MNRQRTARWTPGLLIGLLCLLAQPAAMAQGLVQKTMPYGGATRTWYEHVPPSYDGSRAVPLVIQLHGSGGTGAAVEPNSGWTPKSDAEGFIVVYPNGGTPVPQSRGWSWNTYFQDPSPDDVGFLLALIDRLKTDYCIDADRVYMSGHSNGASMTNTFASVHANVLAAIAPVSGAWITTFNLPESLLTPNAPLPVWTWRGQNENFTTGLQPRPVQDQRQKQFWIAHNRANPAPQVVVDSDGRYTYTTEIYTGGDAEVRFTEVARQSHAYRPEYSIKIWDEFFSQQRRRYDYDFTPVTDLIQDAVNSVPLQGASLLLIKDGRVIYQRAFGGYTLDTQVPIASATKWLSGAVIMSLVDDGILCLDDPVSRYLPSFTGLKGTMTVRQMFSHTSGLPGDHPSLDNPFLTLAQSANQIAQTSLHTPPGTQFVYGGASMQVAGRVAEVASGRSWATLFAERIATLNLTSTSFPLPNPRVPGGARSSLRDYGNFLQMVLNGGVFNGRRVLSAAAVAEMQRDQTFGAPIVHSPHTYFGNGDVRYGIGVWRDLVDAQGDAIQVSSQGAFGFSPWIDNQRKLVGVFLVQNQPRNVYGLVEQMQQMIRDILDATPCNTPPTVTITSPANGASFTAPARITISTSAPDCDGAIHKVEFYAGTRLLGTDTSSPYRFRWNNVPAGSYTLTAKASDNQSAATVSSPVSITVRRR